MQDYHSVNAYMVNDQLKKRILAVLINAVFILFLVQRGGRCRQLVPFTIPCKIPEPAWYDRFVCVVRSNIQQRLLASMLTLFILSDFVKLAVRVPPPSGVDNRRTLKVLGVRSISDAYFGLKFLLFLITWFAKVSILHWNWLVGF